MDRKVKLAIAEMGSEGSDMAIEVSVQYITKGTEGGSLIVVFRHVIVRDDFGRKHASHMLIKRNFSFPLGPSPPVQSKTSLYSSSIAVCKTKMYSL